MVGGRGSEVVGSRSEVSWTSAVGWVSGVKGRRSEVGWMSRASPGYKAECYTIPDSDCGRGRVQTERRGPANLVWTCR